ncbi:hypothetical protein D4764_0092170 [Takifugu flavidus]|uniref:Uncharacterized protein n=1 Tax=Takifugu flavidus TaxID=433684 RepID=A0A5C6MIX1_9TELE|nr:hypothetical protein D4764_0092170 [Takifugu flavidus]
MLEPIVAHESKCLPTPGLEDPGVKLLCGFLQDPLCELETLRSVRGDPVLSQVQKPKPASLLKGQQVSPTTETFMKI